MCSVLIGHFPFSETVFEVVNQENDKLDQKRKSKLANINGHGKLTVTPVLDLSIMRSKLN